mmetsp:Transcript_36294/g.108484  ORF Transcript_36294/g.108484 Transcript_36294/m.108484 type:complete len:268 (+) Transcript_36294:331-1134(+)
MLRCIKQLPARIVGLIAQPDKTGRENIVNTIRVTPMNVHSSTVPRAPVGTCAGLTSLFKKGSGGPELTNPSRTIHWASPLGAWWRRPASGRPPHQPLLLVQPCRPRRVGRPRRAAGPSVSAPAPLPSGTSPEASPPPSTARAVYGQGRRRPQTRLRRWRGWSRSRRRGHPQNGPASPSCPGRVGGPRRRCRRRIRRPTLPRATQRTGPAAPGPRSAAASSGSAGRVCARARAARTAGSAWTPRPLPAGGSAAGRGGTSPPWGESRGR